MDQNNKIFQNNKSTLNNKQNQANPITFLPQHGHYRHLQSHPLPNSVRHHHKKIIFFH